MIQLLIRIAILLFGNNWQSGLATEMGVADRTLRRWLAGTAPIPLGVWYDVRKLLFNRNVEVERMHARLSGLLPDTGKILLDPLPNTRPEADITGVRFHLRRPDGKLISCFAQRGIFQDLGAEQVVDMMPIFQQCSDSFYRAASVKFELREFDDHLGMMLEPADVIVIQNQTTRAAVLRRYGLVDHPELNIRAIRPDDGLWRVAIYGAGNPVTALDVGGAIKMAEELLAIGDAELAAAVSNAADEARRSQAQRR